MTKKRAGLRSVRVALGALALCLALGIPGARASAQLSLGGHVTVADLDSDSPHWGFGGRAVLGVPLSGFGAQGSLTVLEEDCDSGNCQKQILGIDALLSLTVPFVMNPYAGAGVSVEAKGDLDFEWDPGEVEWNLVGGVVLAGPAFPRVHPFVEARYQIRDSRTLFFAGVLVQLF